MTQYKNFDINKFISEFEREFSSSRETFRNNKSLSNKANYFYELYLILQQQKKIMPLEYDKELLILIILRVCLPKFSAYICNNNMGVTINNNNYYVFDNIQFANLQLCGTDIFIPSMSQTVYSVCGMFEELLKLIKTKILDQTKTPDQILDQTPEQTKSYELYIYPKNGSYINTQELVNIFIEWDKKHICDAKQTKESNQITVFKISINQIEHHEEIDNPAFVSYEEQKREMEQELTKMDKKEDEIIKIVNRELARPMKKIKKTTITKEIKCEQKNKCYRPMETLYLQEDDSHKMLSIVSKYKNNPEIYQRLGIRRKLGLLLHGVPGTGKTTSIITIASFLGKDIYYVDLSNVSTNDELQMIFDYATNKCINSGMLVFEDIDCMTNIVKKREHIMSESNMTSLKEHDKLNLSYFLNLLDGTLSAEECIFAITTNHKEFLDPAIYRAGRIDVDIEFKLCDKYQIAMIFNKYIERDISIETLKKIQENKYSPAQITNHLQQFVLSNDIPDDQIMKPFI
jgi:SpoVK/Ycf46/Vps4 family AAA+-type ATPase